jgi:putative glutathione S-transferase
MLVEGKWSRDWDPVQRQDKKGRFVRQDSTFRNWVTPDGAPGPTGEGGFKAEPGRYHLYCTYGCPWASRTLAYRKLKKLDDVISLSIAEPFTAEEGWKFGDFPGCTGPDELNGAEYMHHIYTKADPKFTGRATVPVLWDKQKQTIVNNESADIIRMLNKAFDEFGDASVDLYPPELQADIDALNAPVYEKFNNGVYRSGFAQSQEAYEEGVAGVFEILDMLDKQLSDGRSYLFGDKLTESDIRVFVTLVRFDIAYFGNFKCNLRRVSDYDHLEPYLKRILAIPEIAETVNLDHIKRGYYSIVKVNPLGIVPIGPELSYQ